MVARPSEPAPTQAPERATIHALLAVDGSPASLRAAAQMKTWLAGFPGARLTLMYVAHLPRDLQVSGTGLKLTVEFPLSALVRATSAPVLEAALQALGPFAAGAETEVQVGEPAEEICAFARDEAVDLIIMGVKGTGEVPVGSVSSKVLALADCPVMLVR